MLSKNLPRRALTSALVALALVAAAGCGPKDNPNPKKIDAYVAMGDSYTAVAGVGPFSDAGCRRSVGDYPSLVAKALGVEDFTDASCGGATSAALTQVQTLRNPPGSREPQLASVDARTRLVTLGIGLNDYQTSYYMLYACIPVNGVSQPLCSQTVPESDVAARIKQIATLVKGDLKAVRKAAPNARIILVGYPRVLADDADCPAKLPLPAAAAERVRLGLRLTNAALAATAKKAKVDYVDMWSTEGHDVCSDDPWMAGVANVPGKALQFHPYESYHRAVADRILALLGK